jgi:hypothetical protein
MFKCFLYSLAKLFAGNYTLFALRHKNEKLLIFMKLIFNEGVIFTDEMPFLRYKCFCAFCLVVK